VLRSIVQDRASTIVLCSCPMAMVSSRIRIQVVMWNTANVVLLVVQRHGVMCFRSVGLNSIRNVQAPSSPLLTSGQTALKKREAQSWKRAKGYIRQMWQTLAMVCRWFFSTWWFELRGRELRRVATPHACAVRARPQMEKWYAGELHIVHQRKGALGTDDLLVVGVVSLKKGSQPALG
jgi:hypothetical protein